MLSGVRAEIALKIYGDDLDTLRQPREKPAASASHRSRARRPAGREAGPHSAARDPRRLRPRRALRRQPARGGRRAERLSNGRVVSQVVDGNRRFDVVMRLPDSPHDRGARRPADRDAVGGSRSADRRDRGDRRPQPDPARERPAAHRRSRQHATAARHGADRRGHPAADRRRRACRRATSPSSKARTRPRRRPAARIGDSLAASRSR